MSKAPANHEPAPEFALLRMTAVVDVAVFLTFASLSYPPHFLANGDVRLAFYESFRQLGRPSIPIEGPVVPVIRRPLFVCCGRHHKKEFLPRLAF